MPVKSFNEPVMAFFKNDAELAFKPQLLFCGGNNHFPSKAIEAFLLVGVSPVDLPITLCQSFIFERQAPLMRGLMMIIADTF